MLLRGDLQSKELHRQGDYWLTAKLSVWTDAGACYPTENQTTEPLACDQIDPLQSAKSLWN
jgi:hypothetical protein